MICQVVLKFFLEKDINLYQFHIDVSTQVVYKYRIRIEKVSRGAELGLILIIIR